MSHTIFDIDLSLAEQKTLGLLIASVAAYVGERSKVSSQHKLPTADEIAETAFVSALVVGRPAAVRPIVDAVLASLVKDGKLIQYGCYYSTEPKEVL
jgi:hypothetical protein